RSAVARSVLDANELPRDVDGLKAGDARHFAQTHQRVAVANRALDRLARAAGLHERRAFRDAARRHVRDKAGMRIAHRRPVDVRRYLDDAAADRLGAAAWHDLAMARVAAQQRLR